MALERAAAFLSGKDGFALKRKEEKKEGEKELVDPERLLSVNSRAFCGDVQHRESGSRGVGASKKNNPTLRFPDSPTQTIVHAEGAID